MNWLFNMQNMLLQIIAVKYRPGARGTDTAISKKKKTIEIGCMWTLIITAAESNGR